MSVGKKSHCGGILFGLILGYQSKLPSKQMDFTPTCDSCDCSFPVQGLLLVSAYLWQLEPSLSLRLSLCLTLCLCMSLSLSRSVSFFISLTLSLCEWQTDQSPPLPNTSWGLFFAAFWSSGGGGGWGVTWPENDITVSSPAVTICAVNSSNVNAGSYNLT